MTTYTLIHVLISLVALLAGFVVVAGFFSANRLDGWTAVFLITTVLTSATGFGFPFQKFLPSHAVGILSLLVLAFTIYARYPRRMAGGWRKTYVIGAMISLYLNVFVAIVQAFLKIPALKALAPTQTEPAFKLTQGFVLVLFVALAILATRRFRVESAVPSPASA